MLAPFYMDASRFHGGDKCLEGFAFTERIVDQYPQLVPERRGLAITQPNTVIPAFGWFGFFYDRQSILQGKLIGNPANSETGLTYAAVKYSDLPQNHIIGSGTKLDSARLRTALAAHLGANPHDVQAFVLGEHGDTAMVPWSLTSIAGMKIDAYFDHLWDQHPRGGKKDLEAIVSGVLQAGAEVIKRKAATFYAIALAVRRICEAVLRDTNSVLAVSSLVHGQYGIEDVCLSLPFLVGANGIQGELAVTLTEDEERKLRHSADALKSVLASIQF